MFRLESRKPCAVRRGVVTFAALAALAASGESAASQSLRKDDVRTMSRLSGLPGPAVVSIRQGLAVAIRDRGTRGPDGVVQGVELHGEVIDPEKRAELGFSSMSSRVDVDCQGRRDRVVSMDVFPEHGLKGAGLRRPVPGGWVQPSAQAYLADVLRSVCGLRRNADVRIASLDDGPDIPMTTARPSRPALRPAIDPTPPAPAPEPKVSAPAAPAVDKPAPRAAMTGSVAVQVAALGTEAAANQAARAAARKAPAGAVARVEAARVDGRAYYRALVRGFPSRAEASRFCKVLIADGGACFVR